MLSMVSPGPKGCRQQRQSQEEPCDLSHQFRDIKSILLLFLKKMCVFLPQLHPKWGMCAMMIKYHQIRKTQVWLASRHQSNGAFHGRYVSEMLSSDSSSSLTDKEKHILSSDANLESPVFFLIARNSRQVRKKTRTRFGDSMLEHLLGRSSDWDKTCHALVHSVSDNSNDK